MKKVIYLLSALVWVAFSACNEPKLDIMSFGSISGTVLDGETYEPLQGVLVTTTPASVSMLTDASGKFTISKIQEGDVAVNVKKSEYLANTISVAVYGQQETDTEFLIFKDKNDIGKISIYDPVPGNGAQDQLTGFTFNWKIDGQKSSVILTYSVYIFESGSTVQKLVGDGLTDLQVTINDLKNSTTYYWYVVASYNGSKVANSPTWTFKTKAE